MQRLSIGIVALSFLGLAACGKDAQEIEVQLFPVTSCGDLEQTIRQAARAKMNQELETNLQRTLDSLGPCDWRYGGWYDASMGMADAGMSMPSYDDSPSAPTKDGEQAEQVSGTNTQVQGVDEADFVKNDTKYLYLLAGNQFRIVQAWPPEQATVLASVPLEGTPKRLFVHKDRALIYLSMPGATGSNPYDSGYYRDYECTYGRDCEFTGDGQPTKILVLDLSDKGQPKKVRELDLSASYISSRRVGDAVYTVLSAPGVAFAGLSYDPYLDTCDETLTSFQVRAAFELLRQQNEKIIRETDLGSWLPTMTDTLYRDGAAQSSQDLLAGCGNFYRTSLADGAGLTTVLALDLTAETSVQSATIVSRPGAVYASAESLYFAVSHERYDNWGWFDSLSAEAEASTVHRFQLVGALPAVRYTGSGLVKGRVLNQFSMDEHQNNLRIATTCGWPGSGDVHSTLSVLRQQAKGLELVGQLDNIAPTEDIRAVRFAGDSGYIVTFKQTDPLFVLDLSDPSAPRIDGELKIPGFSTYMQLMDATHLLAIGYEVDDMGGFAWFSGVQLQIFDVSAPQNPKLMHKEVIGSRGSSSEALTNHLAFTYFAPKDLLALPMTLCEGGGEGSYSDTMTFSGLMVYDVTVAAGFSLRGQVAHPTGADITCDNWWTNGSSQVKRSIIMDDYVLSLSAERLKINHLNDLSVDVADLSFTP